MHTDSTPRDYSPPQHSGAGASVVTCDMKNDGRTPISVIASTSRCSMHCMSTVNRPYASEPSSCSFSDDIRQMTAPGASCSRHTHGTNEHNSHSADIWQHTWPAEVNPAATTVALNIYCHGFCQTRPKFVGKVTEAKKIANVSRW